MEIVQDRAELRSEAAPVAKDCVQAGAYLLELSPDWLVLRASENVHRVLGESHVTLIGEPLGRFVHSEALHDLRNLFSRLSGTTGIARAYGIRLTDDPNRFDIAFQLSDGRVILEAVPSSERGFGAAFGTVGGLIAGLGDSSGEALLDAGTRRMRALTGYDRVTLFFGNRRSESSRRSFDSPAELSSGLPALVANSGGDGVPVFPRDEEETSLQAALLGSPGAGELAKLREQGVRASLRAAFTANGETGEFRCDSRTAREPSFELHAAAELYAQLFAMRLEIDRLKTQL